MRRQRPDGGPGTNINFSTNPMTPGYYRLIEGSNAGSSCLGFRTPGGPGRRHYSLSTSVDPGYIDLVVKRHAVEPHSDRQGECYPDQRSGGHVRQGRYRNGGSRH